jgi:osmotically-inducible protein OsmY
VPSAAQEQANPQGGSPQSPLPGRVTGATPTQVQEALDRQLPANAQVTASVADDGSLKLTGTVRSEADKARAEQIAKESSNKTINNQIQVKSSSTWNESPKK